MKKLFALLVMFVVASVMSVYALDIVKANGKYVTKKSQECRGLPN